jgi:hypothetical protein
MALNFELIKSLPFKTLKRLCEEWEAYSDVVEGEVEKYRETISGDPEELRMLLVENNMCPESLRKQLSEHIANRYCELANTIKLSEKNFIEWIKKKKMPQLIVTRSLWKAKLLSIQHLVDEHREYLLYCNIYQLPEYELSLVELEKEVDDFKNKLYYNLEVEIGKTYLTKK